jgi:hypothetical protein
MSETLTMTPEETPAGELNPQEQESLEVGEKLVEAQDKRLAGKYENAEQLEKAYIELEKKLGSQDKSEDISEDKPDEKTNILDQLWNEAESGQKFKKETLEELTKMKAGELAQMHLKYRQEVTKNGVGPKELSEQDITELKGVVGGPDNYNNMMQWANQNLREGEIKMYDKVMELGNPLAAYFAVQALAYRYQDSSGKDGQMITGKAPSPSGDVFKSQAQVVQAMGDPRYDSDPAYRQEVQQKLERSNIEF